MTARLQQALETLYGLERRKDKLGLDGTRALLAALGDPHARFRSIHVAGTNGKGSTCALIERALRAAGVRTGLFTSPHLVDFRERIRVCGRWADEDRLARRLAHIESLPEGRDRTFFEVCTALAFDHFAAERVEWAVVEVGLGGRLDSTNVLTPEVCAITSIGLDHVEILGETLEQIAAEKAGIVKPGVPVVVGVDDPAAEAVILAAARAVGAEVVRPAPAPDTADPMLRLNAGTARAVLGVLEARGVAIPEPAIEEGFRAARWPGRLERAPRAPQLHWDGAHNPAGARALAALLGERRFGALVLALSRDKNAGGMLEALRPVMAAPRLIATRSRSERARPPAEIAAAAGALGWETEIADDVASACARALERAGEAPVLLTGSLFAVGEAMEAFGGAPGEWL